ncbi:MAG: SH3 domain-containing protein [Pseudomonadota bacterium]
MKEISGVRFLTMVAVSFSVVALPALAQTTGSIKTGPSGLPLPRYVSLKAEKVNMRVGPGKKYAIAWRYMKSGLPLEIIQEHDHWRRVRDADGTSGWIHKALLSGRRTAVTAPWWVGGERKDETIPLRKSPSADAEVIAHLKPGVFGHVPKCDGAWCEMAVESGNARLSGHVSQAELWGAYPDEVFD